jgi:hypothetical protein
MIARQGLTVWWIISARDRKTFARNEFFSFWPKTDVERVWPALTTCIHVTPRSARSKPNRQAFDADRAPAKVPLSARFPSMGNLPFWLGIGAAQKSAGSKELKPSRHPIIAFVVGTLIALAIIAGMFALLAYQQ